MADLFFAFSQWSRHGRYSLFWAALLLGVVALTGSEAINNDRRLQIRWERIDGISASKVVVDPKSGAGTASDAVK